MSINHFILFFITMIIITSFISSTAYGHGLGGETHPPVTLEGRDVTLSINIFPPIFDPNDTERYITIDLTESKSQSAVEHVTFTFEMTREGEQIFRRMFHDDLGNLIIKVINDGSDEIKLKGDKSPASDAWMRTTTDPVIMTGPIFDSGGLYDYKIEILTTDSDFNFLDNRLELVGAISLAEYNTYEIIDSEHNTQEIKIISYFDTINDFKFNSNKISFSMPFDWNQDFERLSVVHQEVRISEGFSDFLHTQYNAIINDVQLENTAVTIDDYSFDERTVHIVMNKGILKQIKEQAKQKSDSKMYFELGASKKIDLPLTVTPAQFPIKLESISESNPNNGKYVVDLTWFPNTLGLGKSEFIMTFYEKDTRLTVRGATYDFVLIQNGIEIHRKSGIANAGGTFENFVFVEGETGDLTIRIEKIAGTDEFVEIPINVVPEFPLGILIIFGIIIISIIAISKTSSVKNIVFSN